jgi:hypothetical protein
LASNRHWPAISDRTETTLYALPEQNSVKFRSGGSARLQKMIGIT